MYLSRRRRSRPVVAGGFPATMRESAVAFKPTVAV
jgi:hypothetical protein